MDKIVYLYKGHQDALVDLINFPTGESHIRIRGLSPESNVILINNSPVGDLMRLGMAVDICRRAEVGRISVIIPFVPYARQDQVYVKGDPLSIKVFANFLNSLDIDSVTIVDPHSNVTPALIDNVQVIHQHDLARSAVLMAMVDSEGQPFAIVAPDLGAAKKIKQLQSSFKEYIGETLEVIQCDKTRDPETGKITGFKVLDGDPRGRHCLIVDDICDGGGTFLGIHGALEEAGAQSQSLFVTHGIYSKGVAELKKKFVRLITTDSFPKTEGTIIVSLGNLS